MDSTSKDRQARRNAELKQLAEKGRFLNPKTGVPSWSSFVTAVLKNDDMKDDLVTFMRHWADQIGQVAEA